MDIWREATAGQWIAGQGYEKRILFTDDVLGCVGTLLQEVRIQPEATVALHFHRSCTEVFCMKRGTGFMDINGTRVDLYPGDVLTCHPGDVHNATNTGADDWIYVVFKTNVVPDDMYWVDQ